MCIIKKDVSTLASQHLDTLPTWSILLAQQILTSIKCFYLIQLCPDAVGLQTTTRAAQVGI